MSGPGTPQDKAESFMHTLKAEEVDGRCPLLPVDLLAARNVDG